MDPQQGPPQPDLLIGQTIGNYLVTQKLGEGGMGSVYLAEHPTIGKKVALKVLHPEFATNQEVVERFFTEAKAVNAIGHPNIVDVLDYGTLVAPGRQPLVYFIMEYLAGATLSQIIRAQSPLPPERALTIAIQVADALAASHRTGIVHRDLKPDNIILIQRGRETDFVKLLDFGIAKLTGEARGSSRTRTGLVLGTPAYMSPEQCEGKANVDHRTDIYALGICLYEMLVGIVPFQGEGYGDVLIKHITQKPVEPSQYRMLSPHVEQVVLKALEKRPEQRYPTMDEFMRAMSDPVGYVEAHGGIGGFLATQLMPSSAPLPPVRMTPPPMTGLMSPVPGSLMAPAPTTLGAAAGQVQGPRSKAGFVIASAIVIAAAAGGVFFVLGRNHGPAANDPGNAAVASDHASGVAVTTGSDPVPSPGSAAAATGSARAGSAVASAGSAGSAVASTGSAGSAGSAAVTSAGSGSAVHAVAFTSVTIDTTPPGAEILVNGVRMPAKTNGGAFNLPRDGAHPLVILRLHGYEDYAIRDVVLDQPSITKTIALKKLPPPAHHGGPSAGKDGGKGSATTTKPDDTGLMKPDDL